MGSALLPLLAALFGGGLITAWVAMRKAPVERDSMRVSQADTITDGALALLEQEREHWREETVRFTTAIEKLTGELKAVRRDRAHDQEQCRQLTVANDALQDEVAACQRACREKDQEIARLRADRREPST